MTRWSQNLEQDYILEYFGDYIGTFCSIGENDGITFSNVRALAERSWKGVMIECDPLAYARLEALYKGQPNLYTYDYAITGHNGKAILNKSSSLLKTGDIGLVSTFHASEMERFKRVVTYETEEVKCFKWKTALNRWKIKEFSMISIDCEGEDVAILKQINLTTCKLLVIEWNSVESVKKEILDYTSKFGMNKVIYTSGENLLICR